MVPSTLAAFILCRSMPLACSATLPLKMFPLLRPMRISSFEGTPALFHGSPPASQSSGTDFHVSTAADRTFPYREPKITSATPHARAVHCCLTAKSTEGCVSSTQKAHSPASRGTVDGAGQQRRRCRCVGTHPRSLIVVGKPHRRMMSRSRWCCVVLASREGWDLYCPHRTVSGNEPKHWYRFNARIKYLTAMNGARTMFEVHSFVGASCQNRRRGLVLPPLAMPRHGKQTMVRLFDGFVAAG